MKKYVVDGKQVTKEERDNLLKKDYLYSGMRIRELSEKYGIAEQTIKSFASTKKWKKELKELNKMKDEQMQQKEMEQKADELVQYVLSYSKSWGKWHQFIDKVLEKSATYLITNGSVNAFAVDKMVNSLATAQEYEGKLKGFLTKKEIEDMKMKREKLDMDKEKLEIIKKQNGDDEDSVVEDNFIEAVQKAAGTMNLWKD